LNKWDPIIALQKLIGWVSFREILKRIHEKKRRSTSGRTPLDGVVMVRVYWFTVNRIFTLQTIKLVASILAQDIFHSARLPGQGAFIALVNKVYLNSNEL